LKPNRETLRLLFKVNLKAFGQSEQSSLVFLQKQKEKLSQGKRSQYSSVLYERSKVLDCIFQQLFSLFQSKESALAQLGFYLSHPPNQPSLALNDFRNVVERVGEGVFILELSIEVAHWFFHPPQQRPSQSSFFSIFF